MRPRERTIDKEEIDRLAKEKVIDILTNRLQLEVTEEEDYDGDRHITVGLYLKSENGYYKNCLTSDTILIRGT